MRLMLDIIELSKLRLCALAVMMGALGFVLGEMSQGYEIRYWKLGFTVFGMLLIGACSGALNQYIEVELDSQMRRTRNRPLPDGRITRKFALIFGVVTGAVGEMMLLIAVNPVTAVLGAFTLFFYLAVYTPYKRVNSMSTLVGAIPGALPPLMGWTGSLGLVTAPGFILFSILFLWQIPHFLAIAWIYRQDYRNADFPVLPVVDSNMECTKRQMILYTLGLICVSVLPSFWGIAGGTYFLGAMGLGAVFLLSVLAFAWHCSEKEAKRVFHASLIYLPALILLLVADFNG